MFDTLGDIRSLLNKLILIKNTDDKILHTKCPSLQWVNKKNSKNRKQKLLPCLIFFFPRILTKCFKVVNIMFYIHFILLQFIPYLSYMMRK